MFESVDGRMDGRQLDSHPISSSRAFGFGELKISPNNPQNGNGMVPLMSGLLYSF